MMRTITINGEEYPVPKGCPDFAYYRDEDSPLFFLGVDWRFLADSQKRHAACVAAQWFRDQAKNRIEWWCDNGNHVLSSYQVKNDETCSICGATARAVDDPDCTKAAEKWGRLVRWG